MTVWGTLVALMLAGPPAGAASAPTPAATPADAAKSPRIGVEPARVDFGRVLADRTLSRQVFLRNFGSADLVIEGISTTCGCTVALLESKVIKPGGRSAMRISFDTRSLSGKVARSVLIRSNDPIHAVLEMTLEATVAPAEKDLPKP
jgi:hypothetical protein